MAKTKSNNNKKKGSKKGKGKTKTIPEQQQQQEAVYPPSNHPPLCNSLSSPHGESTSIRMIDFEKKKAIEDEARNFVESAGPGCHMARPPPAWLDRYPKVQEVLRDDANKDDDIWHDDWVLEWEPIDPDDFDDLDEIPDLAVDPDASWTLSVCNAHPYFTVAYITVHEHRLQGRDGQLLHVGTSTDHQGQTSPVVTTLIVLCPPHTFGHLANIVGCHSLDDLQLESDVQEWNQHPDPYDVYQGLNLSFPLQTGSVGDNGWPDSYLCTQGVGGHLTHFFSGNLHAIDYRCPIGTPLLAVADGTIVAVQDHNTCTGIGVTNLFHWNSIMLRVEASPSANIVETKEMPLFVEYVHISRSAVSVGTRVARGQVIGFSGSVGFSPEPHLHLAAYRSDDPTACTVQVSFQDGNGQGYLPRAGLFYDGKGPVSALPNQPAC